jgi:exodeoxyribonuclease VII small subunit
MSDDDSAAPEPAGYGEAVTELEAILREIEDADVDVDVLAERVQRAAHLIEWCRGRIIAARQAVDDATSSLEAGDED